jgi:hypothetical protein
LTRQFFDGDRFQAEKVLAGAFENPMMRAFCGACTLQEFIPHPLIALALCLLEAESVSLGEIILHATKDCSSSSVASVVASLGSHQSLDELKVWGVVVTSKMATDPVLHLFFRNLLKRQDFANVKNEMKESLFRAHLHWMDFLWEKALLDDEDRVNVVRLRSVIGSELTVVSSEILHAVCGLLKAVKLAMIDDKVKELASLQSIKTWDIVTVFSCSPSEAMAVLESISEISGSLCQHVSEDIIAIALLFIQLFSVYKIINDDKFQNTGRMSKFNASLLMFFSILIFICSSIIYIILKFYTTDGFLSN